MDIAKDCIVSMHYTLKAPDGEVIDTSSGKDPLAYLHGHGNIISGLETRLEGKRPGSSHVVDVPAAEAYGEHDPEKTIPAKREQFPEDTELKPGMQFQANGPQGPMVVKIAEVEGDTVTLDANHPLAGVDLKFEVDIVEVREASEEELEHGHAHGPGGHQHES